MKNQVTGALLSESGNTTRLDNPNRVVTASFKGMTSEKIKEIQDEQARQAREKEVDFIIYETHVRFENKWKGKSKRSGKKCKQLKLGSLHKEKQR